MTPNLNREVVDAKGACEFLGLSPASLSRAVNGKLANTTQLPVIRYGRVHRFRIDTLIRWQTENETCLSK